MSGPVLEVRGLEKHYGTVHALRGIDLSIDEGAIYGFLGPNGAGKTTTIRIIAGLIQATAGSVALGGIDLREDRIRAATGLRTLVEVPSFYPAMSGRTNLKLFARLAKADPKDVDRLLDAVGLTHAADRAVGGYSLGMRQRLGIAQALVGKPRLVVLDEPMNGLDPAAMHEMRRLIREERDQRGVTFFLSSHLLHDVELLCDEVGIIHEGRMVAEGRLKTLLSQAISGFRITTVNNEAAATALRADRMDLKPRLDPDGALLIDGDETTLPYLHRTLVDAGTPAIEIIPLRESLERYFLDKTEGVMG
ncbi:MAG: ABC transporter ATP-binding protein [Planctomycetota bacterium]|nr:ABC transporter ATP-binding protein [Planctomycetota bacterium]